jgi:hypothetical protein
VPSQSRREPRGRPQPLHSMKTSVLAVVLLSLSLPVPASQATSRCVPLLSDPAGDVQETGVNPPAPVEDVRQVDLLSVDLTSGHGSITASFQVVSLDPEARPLEAHAYEVGFTSNGQRYYLYASHDASADEFWVVHQLGDSETGEDKPLAPGAREVLGEASGSYQPRQRRITITARLSQFEGGGGLGKELSSIRSTTYAGSRAPGGEAYEFADHGRTEQVYRLGTAGCTA